MKLTSGSPKLMLVVLLFTSFVLRAQTSYFRMAGGLPHFPVFANTGSVSSPKPGAVIYSTANGTLMVYTGSAWDTFCTTLMASSTGAFTRFTVSGGIPYLPVLSTTAVTGTTAQAGTLYFPSNSAGVQMNNGSSWYTIHDLATTATTPATGVYGLAGNLTGLAGGLTIPVLTADPTFAATDQGAAYLNATDKELHINTGSAWIAQTCCPASITVNHVAGLVSPITTTITYGVDQNNYSGTTQCWITRNLGATTQATSATDASDASAGWYWQFNRKQGYAMSGSTRTPATTWITSITGSSDWTAANDPCTLLLGSTWRLPTQTEWASIVTNASITNYTNAYGTTLKLHAAGLLETSALLDRGSYGCYWSSTQNSTTDGYFLFLSSSSASPTYANSKADGFSVRCLQTY